MTHYALSLGAGVNSTAMLLLIVDRKIPLDEVVFADTGAEKPETYQYLKRYIMPFCAEKGVPFVTVRAKETLIERCMRGHTVPDRRYRWSTRDYKIRPINKHLKVHLPDCVVYIGIGYDEVHRMSKQYDREPIRQWPLIDLKLERSGCEKLITEHGWPVPVKSGCFFCPFQRLSDWGYLYLHHRDLWEQAKVIEQNGSKYPDFPLWGKTGSPTSGLIQLEMRFRREGVQQTMRQTLSDDECAGFCMT